MNIVVATDNNFVQHCAVMLISVLENNKHGINIYLLSEGITDDNFNRLKEIVISRGGHFYYILIDSELLKSCPLPDLAGLSHISIATYYRLLIPNLLPLSVSKVIYLDCDIIVRKSIQNLWDTNIDIYAIAAVYQMTNRTLQDAQRLGYPISFGYFNAGVLLINIYYWRTHSISLKLMNFINSHLKDIIFHDQDALNAVLYDKCLKLSCKWNMLTIFFKKNIFEIVDINKGKIINKYDEYKTELKAEPYDPSIIHFASKPKPWDTKCTHPFRYEYYRYLKKTPWKKFTAPSPLISYLYRVIRKTLLMLTLKGETYFNVKKN